MNEPINNKQNNERVWYAIQTLHCKEERLGQYLATKGLNYFIPMQYVEQITLDGKRHRVLTPAIHNLLFVEKTFDEKEIRSIVTDSPVPLILVRHRDTKKYYEIPDREMLEFRAICDPNYTGTLYVEAAVAEARPGSRIRVIHGAFKGLEGKLTRYKNRYYVVITVASIGVMIHIPKWYCMKLE